MRIRKAAWDENFSTLSRVALSLLKQEKTASVESKTATDRRMDDDYMA